MIRAYFSFIQEFISEPLDGVSLVVEALRSIQLSQNSPLPLTAVSNGNITSQSMPPARQAPAQQRRALLDELACL